MSVFEEINTHNISEGMACANTTNVDRIMLVTTMNNLFYLILMDPLQGTKIAKYALVGAACQLGGTVRMTISLAVIILECTGDITFGVPIILSLFVSKWIGDFFNPVSLQREEEQYRRKCVYN